MEFRMFKLIRSKNSIFNDGVPTGMKYSVEIEIDNHNPVECNPIYFRLFKKKTEAEDFIKQMKEMKEENENSCELYIKNNLSFIKMSFYKSH